MTSRRILIPIAIAVVLALVVLFVSLRPSSIDRTSAGLTMDARTPAARTSTLAEAKSKSTGDRTNVAATTQFPRLPGFAEVTGVRLVVVDSDSRDPVPGAVVYVFDDESGRFGETSNCEQWMGPDVTAFIAAHGTKLVSDADGAVDLPVVRIHRFATASKADKSGLLEVDANMSGLFEIEIQRAQSLDVHVRDTEGKLVTGVPVALYPWSDSSSLSEAVTDEHGSCRFADFHLFTRLPELGTGEMIVVRLALPFEPFVEEWIDPAHIPDTPVELVMPPSGSLIVSVVDQDHHVVRVPGTIFLFSADATVHTRLDPSRSTSAARIPFENGVARIDGIGLGQELGMNVDFRGEGDTSVDVHGPKKAGEVVTVETEFLSSLTLLSGRIVDDSHTPLASKLFQWQRTVDDGRSFKAAALNNITTDADGRFVWTMSRTPESDAGPFTHRDGYLCEFTSAKVRKQARLKFPLEFTDMTTDLGDIVVSNGPPLASGRVVDEAGRAIAGGMVTVLPIASARRDAISVCTHCITRDDGSFAVFGPCLDLPLALRVQADNAKAPRSQSISCGGGPMTITLKRSGTASLMGTALVDRGAVLGWLEVKFIDADNDRHRSFPGNIWHAGDRVCFAIPDLPLTSGRVELDCATGSPTLHAVIDGITIATCGESRPSQLADFDLRGKLPLDTAVAAPPTSEFEIVDSSGRAVPHGLVWVRNAADDETTQHTWTGGHASILETDALRVEIWAAGFREKVLQPVPRTARVVLEPEIEVELRFDVPREFQDAGATLRGSIVFGMQADTEFVPSSLNGDASFVLDREGRALVRLPVAGPFQASLSLSRVGVPGMDEVQDEEIAVLPNPLIVRDVAGRQSIDCTLDEFGVRHALESLGVTRK